MEILLSKIINAPYQMRGQHINFGANLICVGWHFLVFTISPDEPQVGWILTRDAWMYHWDMMKSWFLFLVIQGTSNCVWETCFPLKTVLV